jgi:hypothetical protein
MLADCTQQQCLMVGGKTTLDRFSLVQLIVAVSFPACACTDGDRTSWVSFKYAPQIVTVRSSA